LKGEKMIAFLVSNPMSGYYQTENFGKILHFVAVHPRQCQLRDQNNRRSVVVSLVRTVDQAYKVLSEIDAYKQ